MSKHEARESESLLVSRNSVKNSVTSWKPPPPPPPGARIHEHDSGPSDTYRASMPGPSPMTPVLETSTSGPATHCRGGAAVQKKRGQKTRGTASLAPSCCTCMPRSATA